MKLRNKKTGEIADIDLIKNREDGGWLWEEFNYLTELNAEWEDYKPAEPLIKDEKVRKAVRAWWEANKIDSQDTIRFDAIEHSLTWVNTAIEFNESKALSDLEKVDYTIAELCGEEEE